MTSGMLFPAGTLVNVNLPSTAVVAPTRGEPDACAQLSHDTLDVKGATGALGTYTTAFGNGSTPFGAYTVPLTLVVAFPAQVTCCKQRFVQEGFVPHTLGVPLPPHVAGQLQLPQLRSPPQPSDTGPQFLPSWAQVFGTQAAGPHAPAMPPPPQVCGEVQLPQLSRPPQELLAGPQLTPRLAHVAGVHGEGGAPQAPGVPPPPHVCGDEHVPQFSRPPQP